MKYLEFEHLLPMTLDEAWSFFSSPGNLNLITPDDLDFKILDTLPDQMYQGLMIRYKIKPMLNIPLDWVTEITMIKDKEYFIDEQRKGPYRIWHHEHHFKEVQGGVLMTDKLYYDIGMSFIGTIAGALWVDKQVQKIFTYRKTKLNELGRKYRAETQRRSFIKLIHGQRPLTRRVIPSFKTGAPKLIKSPSLIFRRRM